MTANVGGIDRILRIVAGLGSDCIGCHRRGRRLGLFGRDRVGHRRVPLLRCVHLVWR